MMREELTRREALQRTAALWASGWALAKMPASGAERTNPKRAGNPHWYQHAWRRAVIDMHIPDWDEKFLSQFDPDQYVAMLRQSRAQSVVMYAQSHVGLFNYPTKVGQPHRSLGGRDIVAELIERCHRFDIAVVLYTSVIHDRWAADQHPDWRIVHPNGRPFGLGSRHGFVCPNSPYRDYVKAWVDEIAQRYDFEGMRFDMTFWTCVCYCPYCQKRWQDEVGGEMPRTVDWTDERWVRLKRKREQWLGEFASLCTETVKQHRPRATVEHQSSTYPLSWNNGVSWPLLAQNDFLQGDFYGDALQGSFVRKLLEDLTPHQPFGYETSFSVELWDHTGKKSEPLLEAKASAAIADAAAFIFIDAIDPVGMVNPNAHERMGRVFDRLMPYYAHLGGERVMDIGVYYSLDSKFDMRSNGQSVLEVDNGADSHTRSTMQAARRLIAGHLPFGVITKKSLHKLDRIKTLILSNVHHMDVKEITAIRDWVDRGGTLYASGATSLVNTEGHQQDDFMLADVFGVSLVKADWTDHDHYVAPTDAGRNDLAEWNAKYPAFVRGPGMEVRAHTDATVLATTTLPWPAPNRRGFSSIHSNPPWQATKRPEIVLHRFGKGRVIYSGSLIEEVEGLKESFLRLLRRLNNRFAFEIETHPAIEATLFRQPDRHRYILSLVNFQKDLPNLPVDDIRVTLRLPELARQVKLLPEGRTLPHHRVQEGLSFRIPKVVTLAMVAVETRA